MCPSSTASHIKPKYLGQKTEAATLQNTPIHHCPVSSVHNIIFINFPLGPIRFHHNISPNRLLQQSLGSGSSSRPNKVDSPSSETRGSQSRLSSQASAKRKSISGGYHFPDFCIILLFSSIILRIEYITNKSYSELYTLRLGYVHSHGNTPPPAPPASRPTGCPEEYRGEPSNAQKHSLSGMSCQKEAMRYSANTIPLCELLSGGEELCA